ncbi:MAG: nitrilase-related carbon-nitrogen hydrolase [Planctomycetota bacterium]|nr:nitrilase-related carbon-nitrogen hydrolase [Planctomycetota bacterium]
MQDIRVAAVSINSPLDSGSSMLDCLEQWTGKAVEQGAELILFPELQFFGHCNPRTWELAEAVPAGAATQRTIEIAKKHSVTLCIGISEKEDDVVFNTQFLVGPNGFIGKQRKLHLSRDEVLFYKGGREVPVFDIGKCRVGMIICYDNQLPEVARIHALRGADVLLMPHAARIKMWDETADSMAAARQHTHEYFTSCYAQRARENACFAVLANQAGRAGYVETYPQDSPAQPHHCGGALVFAPDGELIGSTQTDVIQDEMIVVDLLQDRIAKERSLPNYTLKTRRPELYQELVSEQVKC